MWKLRDIVVTAILSVVGGAVYLGWDYATGPLWSASLSPAVQGIVNGVWWLPAVLIAYIVRRPGAALLGGFLSSVVEFALGSPYGAGAMLSGLVQGGGAEVGFLLLGYRRWNLASVSLAGAVGGIGNTVQWLFQYGGDKYSAAVMIGYTVVTLLSGIIIAGFLPKWIGDALNRTGVVRSFEIGRQTRSSHS